MSSNKSLILSKVKSWSVDFSNMEKAMQILGEQMKIWIMADVRELWSELA